MTTFRSVPCFVRFGLLLAVLFVFTMSGEVQAQQQKRTPNKPAPRAPYYYNPLVFDYQGAVQQINNLPAAYYGPRYYPPYPPYPPYPHPHPYPVPRPIPGPLPHPFPGAGLAR